MYHKDGKHTRCCYICQAARVEVGGVAVVQESSSFLRNMKELEMEA